VTDARKIELLQILADGCHKHPAYRAKRQVKIDCQPCVVIWNARLELEAEKLNTSQSTALQESSQTEMTRSRMLPPLHLP
jgi:hypothetical protein